MPRFGTKVLVMDRVDCLALAAAVWVVLSVGATRADDCPQPDNAIATDRPDTTNSSLVVPRGSFQNENGINLSRRDGAHLVDGTNSRLRLGVGTCFEILLDLPNYTATVGGTGPSRFADAAPAVKWQVSPAPGKVDLSMVVGAALPTGSRMVRENGTQPYLQFPWSCELTDGWSVTGMVTNFFMPKNAANKYTNQSTLVIEREFAERSFLFAEYVGEFPVHGSASHLFNSGGGYRITPTQQIDFHVALGLNRAAPDYVFGVGYSFRLDKLF